MTINKLTSNVQPLDVINQGNEIVDSSTLSNFLPAGTIITVETDGSGDFTELSDAVNYLTGKYSNGEVKIELGEGTFNESQWIKMNGTDFNIPYISIIGKGTSNTIIEWDYSETTSTIFSTFSVSHLYLSEISFKNKVYSESVNYWGFQAWKQSNVEIHNCNFENLSNSITSNTGSNVSLSGTINIKNTRSHAIQAQFTGKITSGEANSNIINIENSSKRGDVVSASGGHLTLANTKLNINNANCGVSVSLGGLIQFTNVTFNFTNVTTKCNVTPNTISSNGIAMGFTV